MKLYIFCVTQARTQAIWPSASLSEVKWTPPVYSVLLTGKLQSQSSMVLAWVRWLLMLAHFPRSLCYQMSDSMATIQHASMSTSSFCLVHRQTSLRLYRALQMCIAPQVLQTGTYQYKDSQRLTVVYTSGSEVHTGTVQMSSLGLLQ